MATASLDALPEDCLVAILLHVPPACIIGRVAPTCTTLLSAAHSDGLWQSLIDERYDLLLRCLFGGTCPPPPPNMSWCAHYFDLASSFLQHARLRGRVVMTIDNVVYDATPYVDKHPGDIEVLLAAAGHDATAAFHAVGHSTTARHILGTLAVASRDALVPREDAALAARWRRHAHAHRRGHRREHWSGGVADGHGASGVGGAVVLEPADEAPTWRAYGQALLAGMRSQSGRSSLRSMLRLSLTALVTDLTEGRPDCRRLSPAVWRLVERELLATPRWKEQGSSYLKPPTTQ